MKHTLFSIVFLSAFLQGFSQNCTTIRRCYQDTTQLVAQFNAANYSWETGTNLSTLSILDSTASTFTTVPVGEDQYFLVTAGVDSTCWLLKTITLDISGETVLCEDAQISINANTSNCNNCPINWSIANETGTGSGNSFTFDPSAFSIDTPTTYSVNASLTYAEGGNSSYECELTSSITVTVNPTPEFTLDNELCAGQSLSPNGLADGIIYNFAWTVGTDSYDESSIPVDLTTADNVTLTITDDLTGCATTVNQTLTVNPLPSFNLLVEDACLNAQVEYTLSVFEGNVSYEWNDNPSNNMENFIIPSNAAGESTVSLLVTDANSCQFEVNETYFVFALPSAQIEGPGEACAESEVAFTAQTNATSYNWTVEGNAESITTNNLVYTFSTSGEYTIQLVVTDANNCTANDEVVIGINPLPVATISGDNTLCSGVSSNYTVNAVNAVIEDIQWNGSETTDTLQFTADADGDFTIGVLVTDDNGCQDNDEFTITVNPLPVFDFTGNTLICGTTNYQLSADGIGYNYEWLLPESGFSIIGDSLSYEGEYGPLQILLIATDPSSTCTDTVSIEAMAITGPVSGLPVQVNICEGEGIILEGVSGYDYTWTVLNQEVPIDTAYGYPFAADLASGNYTIITTIVDTTQLGCFSIDTVLVSINSNPTFFLSAPLIACAGQTLETNVYDVAVNNVPVVDYIVSWTTAEGFVSTGNTYTDSNPTIGNYTVYVQVTEAMNSCFSIDTLETVITEGPSFVHSIPVEACVGDIILLSLDTVEVSNISVLWSIGGSEVNDYQAYLTLNDSVTEYSVSVTNLNTGCITDSTYAASANPLPDAVEINMLTEGLLSINSALDNDYQWGYTSAATGIEITNNNSGNYAYFENFDPANNYYWVEYANTNGCVRRVYFNAPITSINAVEEVSHVIAFPIPAMDKLTVTGLEYNNNSVIQYTIVNALGQSVLRGSTNAADSRFTLDVSELSKGQYYLQIETSNKLQHISFTK